MSGAQPSVLRSGTRRGVLAGLTGAALVVATAAPTLLATPALASATGGGPPRSVTLVLTPPDRPALRALAHIARLPKAERVRRLARLRPSTAQQDRVATLATSLGLRVTGRTPWSVVVSGPAATVDRLFGSARARHPHARGRGSVGQPLPGKPASLAALVTVALGGDETRRAVRPLGLPGGLSGPTVRSAYHAPDGTPPTPGGAGQTVATLQFSGWDASALDTYARAVTDDPAASPVASGQYTAVSVDGADPSSPDGYGGEGEVALDQEAIFSTAPNAAQRAYFAPNSDVGEVDALNRVAADATDAAHGYYNLSALSISWGMCESLRGGPDALTAQEDALNAVLAAGVTIFAASGDSGAYGCSTESAPDDRLDVNYPASSPWVVGVGGTRLDAAGSAWSETAWSTPSAQAAPGWLGFGTGGGQSAFPLPDYQRPVAAGRDHRLVPDIALDADPETGYAVYDAGRWRQVGGTSLASPLAAAQLADVLGSTGYFWGIGYLHPNLYGAPSSAFRDVVTGDNLHDAAGPGYDLATGLGAPLWNELAPSLVGAPTLSAPRWSRALSVPVTARWPQGMRYYAWRGSTAHVACDASRGGWSDSAPHAIRVPRDGAWTLYLTAEDGGWACHEARARVTVDSHAPSPRVAITVGPTSPVVTFRWNAADPAPSSGLQPFDVTITHVGATHPDWHAAETRATSRTFTGRPGVTYLLFMRAHDAAGNLSGIAGARATVPVDERAASFSGRWVRATRPAFYGGTATGSRGGGAATLRVRARTLSALLLFGPDQGRTGVWVDGRLVRVVDGYSAAYRWRTVVPIAGWATAGWHTVTFRPLGTRSPASRATWSTLDAVVPQL